MFTLPNVVYALSKYKNPDSDTGQDEDKGYASKQKNDVRQPFAESCPNTSI